MNTPYSIQKPCTEDWGKMSTEEQGRHCQVCCKTVVDFSQKSNAEIIGFLQNNSDKKVCGRFRSEQLSPRPTSHLNRPTNRYRIFFAALVFVFGGMLFTSCHQIGNEPLMGTIAYVPDSLEQKKIDTASLKNVVTDTTKKTGSNKKTKCPPTKCEENETFLMGDVAYDPKMDSIK